MEDMNTPEFMDKLKRSIFENLRDKTAAPSVQMQGEFAEGVPNQTSSAGAGRDGNLRIW
jgi:hypothetical protein